MGLFKPAWQSKNPTKRLKAIKKLTDQNILFGIVTGKYGYGYFTEHRIAAINNLTSQTLLAKIAKKADWNSTVVDAELAAVKKLTDQSILADVAENAHHRNIRAEAAIKSTDQAVILSVIKDFGITPNSESVRLKMAKTISDQSLVQYEYANIVVSGDKCGYDTRYEAFKCLTDQVLLADVAKRARDNNIRDEAIEKLTDQNLIAGVLKNQNYYFCDESIRAISRITDQRLIADIVLNAECYENRVFTIDRLTDQAILQSTLFKIAKNDKYGKLRIIAIEKLTDKDILNEIINGNEVDYCYKFEEGHEKRYDETYWTEYTTHSIDLREIAKKSLGENTRL